MWRRDSDVAQVQRTVSVNRELCNIFGGSLRSKSVCADSRRTILACIRKSERLQPLVCVRAIQNVDNSNPRVFRVRPSDFEPLTISILPFGAIPFLSGSIILRIPEAHRRDLRARTLRETLEARRDWNGTKSHVANCKSLSSNKSSETSCTRSWSNT